MARLVVSEFPNDNPELHDGLVWAAPSPCAPALPTLRLRPSAPVRVLRPEWEPRSDPRSGLVPPERIEASHAPPQPAVESLVVESPAIDAPVVESPTQSAPASAPASAPVSAERSGFEAFVGALSETLAERGATRAAANVGALLGQKRLARDAFDAETRKALVARGLIDVKTARPTPEFSMVAQAWREVLEGTSTDLAACGSATLDVWGAEVLSALLGSRERSDELRRALRQRGVAAFGMLAAA
jgi:hypothetical protein